MNNNSFILYADWKKIFELLPTDEERVMLLYLMFDLVSSDGEETQEQLTAPVIAAWEFLSPKIIENLKKWEDERQKRSEAGRLGGIKSGESRRSNASKCLKQNEAVLNFASESFKQNEANEAVTVTGTVTVTDTVTDTVPTIPSDEVIVGELKENSKEKRFIKPTLEEIELFIFDNNYSVDAEAFFDYYESVGWSVGKKKMKDWKAAVRTWQKREQPKFGDSFFDVD